jgi:hypothetical protein
MRKDTRKEGNFIMQHKHITSEIFFIVIFHKTGFSVQGAALWPPAQLFIIASQLDLRYTSKYKENLRKISVWGKIREPIKKR